MRSAGDGRRRRIRLQAWPVQTETGEPYMTTSRLRCQLPSILSIGLTLGMGCNSLLEDTGSPTVSADSGSMSGSPSDASLGQIGPMHPDAAAAANADATIADSRKDATTDGGPEAGDDAGQAWDDAPDSSGEERPGEAGPEGGPEGGPETGAEGGPGPCTAAATPSRIVLFGGNDSTQTMLDDTWEWNGTAWSLRSPAAAVPTGRWSQAMVPFCGQAVMFGGSTTSSLPYLDDQWSWDGTSWTENDAAAPPARLQACAAVLGGAIVLFGGNAMDAGDPSPDTWVMQEGHWSMVPNPTPSTSPSARALAAMFALGGYVVLFGGLDTDGNVLGDTWTWNGASWTLQSPHDSPPARFASVAVSFGNRGLMFGGLDDNGAYLGDTWAWDGSDWTNVTPAMSPPVRSQPAAATLGDEVILFGGQGKDGLLGDTWGWDGVKWTALDVSGPSPRYGSTMTAF
jgi:hypothetical protein